MYSFLRKYYLGMTLAFVSVTLSESSHAQAFKNGLPAIEVLLSDSSRVFRTTTFDKSKPVVLLLFHTTCEHCQQEARDLLTRKKELEKIRLVMISTEPLSLVRAFYRQYALSQVKDLVIGRDHKLVTPKMFMYESFPFCAVYGKSHRFIRSFERNFNTDSILSVLKRKGEIGR